MSLLQLIELMNQYLITLMTMMVMVMIMIAVDMVMKIDDDDGQRYWIEEQEKK